MKIKDIEKRINASYNTIKKFIEKNPKYNEKVDNVLHATELGLKELELEYGVKSEILSDDNINFYKSQVFLLNQQLEDNKKYNNIFMKQIEVKDIEVENAKNRLAELEKSNQLMELENIKLEYELEMERNKSIWKKIFNK